MKFPPPFKVNSQEQIFQNEINHSLLVIILPIYINFFFNTMYSQNDEIDVLELLEFKINFTA